MPTQEVCDVVLPAGGRISGEFAQQAGTEIKALILFEARRSCGARYRLYASQDVSVVSL